MSRWHNVYADGCAHYCTASVHGWEKVLVGDIARVLLEEWESAREALGVQILAYCVMPSHFHILLYAESGRSVMRFLQMVLGRISMRLKPGGGFWKERPRVIPVYSRSVLITKVDYIHDNPRRGKLAHYPGDWEHSSFRQLVLGASDAPLMCDDWKMVPI